MNWYIIVKLYLFMLCEYLLCVCMYINYVYVTIHSLACFSFVHFF